MTPTDLDTEARLEEPISPELVLVDPELAVRARALLPEVALSATDVAAARAAEPAPHEVDTRADVQPAGPAQRLYVGAGAVPPKPRRYVGAGAVPQKPLGYVGAGAVPHVVRRSPARRRTVWTPAVAFVVVAVVGSFAATELSRPSVRITDEPGAAQLGRGPARGADAGSRDGSASPRRPRAEAEPRLRPSMPAQRFVWLPAAGATHYRVDFRRRGTLVFRAFPTRPVVVLPSRWRLRGRVLAITPGRYQWTVRPGFGSRKRPSYGRPTVVSTWVVPSPAPES